LLEKSWLFCKLFQALDPECTLVLVACVRHRLTAHASQMVWLALRREGSVNVLVVLQG
jgi:hypothetical protein